MLSKAGEASIAILPCCDLPQIPVSGFLDQPTSVPGFAE